MPLPQTPQLLGTALEHFRAAFGAPHRTGGADAQWSLRASSQAAAINVLLDGSDERPIVRMFDPHHAGEGVTDTPIDDEAQLSKVIKRIQERVSAAARPEPVPAPAAMRKLAPARSPEPRIT